MAFPKIDPKQSFPKMEEEILKFWEKEKVFEKSLAKNPATKEFKFFDGPPFATGLPHYGHILQGVIKDLIPRYKTMQGYRVPRVWGWDCHGLPVENLIEKDLGLKSKQDIEKYGVDKFNEQCRESVLKYAEEWGKTVKRMGRWIDVENAYKTMDLQYMDSVWWVFGELWKKDLIYEGLKPMHVCPHCATPLSLSEVGMNYRDVTDLSATAKFELEDEPGNFLLAWTTTPWTLPGNVALAVNPKIEYLALRHTEFKRSDGVWISKTQEQSGGNLPNLTTETREQTFIASHKFFEKDFASHGKFEFDYYDQKYETFSGTELIEKYKNGYKPLFNYFADKKNEGAFRVVAADFVTTEDGTGIVHIAPAFGEDDYDLAKKENLPVIKNVSLDGKFSDEVKDFAGMEVKPKDDPTKTDRKIVEFLGNQIFATQNYKHSYPFCWRCESPLLNYATSSWFVAVEKLKSDLLAGNEKINWIPEHIKNGRFGKWLQGARDWAISRNRFWGAPLPIWKCEKCGELKCVSSKDELEKLSGEKVNDLHKHFADEISWKCDCGATMKRIPEVLDCWFESGSMPFAQFGEKADAKIPADFIAEAQDQTRGWFYTLHVLATALKNSPAFSNCVCSGLILAEDGEKMSKSKQNFPPPAKIFDEFGADAMRLYLMNSSVTHAEDLRFSEKGVEETLRSVLLPLWNTFYFFTTYANADGWEPTQNAELKTQNPLDKWILSELNILVREMTENLEKYEIQKAVSPLAKFLDGLTNWYIRRSRRRFWKSENDEDKNEAYVTLFEVLKTVAKLLAPITPFLAEKIWRDLGDGESVHLEDWPEVDDSRIDESLSAEVEMTQKIISLGLKIRANEKIKVRQPLEKATVALPSKVNLEIETIREELNLKKIELTENPDEIAEKSVVVNARTAGKRLGAKIQKIIAAAKAGEFKVVDGGVKILDEILSGDEISIGWRGKSGATVESEDGIVVALDTKITPELELEGQARDLVRAIQDLRKTADFDVSDQIELQLENADDILAQFAEYISTEVLAEKIAKKIDSPAAEGNLEKIKIGVKKI
ncbi:isoleucine--tRNA ligase [Candidatus Gracilibacteria bacterium]|nr:isoleucine--tRNA ligase [Candidatus Gracilibacteria bacterium]MCF7856270.1 isoleucine--tRNA ligase [Candidatus Gracilibacteria bacterium]MCF7896251.1 isoleucine--tRNA ligase [Candidatus Gracilibacteria bacterium]